MAIKNTAGVYIDGILRSSHTVMPLKWVDFLDERLDECRLSLRAIKKQIFQPLTPVEIEINNELYFKLNQTEKLRKQTKYYVVANDTATETQVGSGLYNHDLSLIEVTKVAECYVGDTTTITNDLGRSYTENASYAKPIDVD